ncbi:hypothetical protein PV11_10135 [Exophiala sideris]|uniref:Uncharacterized protein n=1 Tax=Exophiala sideris TaxID=1016849 RepID=A0A0D1WTE3_9EURO|nr:hypothetical protein PV11_10135 [Exophiala sideris]
MAWWLWHIEKRLIETLLNSPSFHRGVQKVHKTVHQLQHGKPPEYYGGTHIERTSKPRISSLLLRLRPHWKAVQYARTRYLHLSLIQPSKKPAAALDISSNCFGKN